MDKIPRMKGKELGTILKKVGFILDHQTGSHRVYRHPDGRKTVIPCHSGKIIGPGLLNTIIKKDLMMTREDFLELLKARAP